MVGSRAGSNAAQGATAGSGPTNAGERSVDICNRLLADRIIYLGTGIDDGVTDAAIAQLLHPANENPDTPISLYRNSVGGAIPATLAICDAMQFVRPPVETTCVGQVVASAAVLLAGGAIPDLILEADEVPRVPTLQELLLSQHTGRSPEQLREDTERDLILTPEDAVAYGVVDRVLTGVPTEPRPG